MKQTDDMQKLMLESVRIQRQALIVNVKTLLSTVLLVILAIVMLYVTLLSVFDKNIVQLSITYQTSINFVQLLILLTIVVILTLVLSLHCIFSNLPRIPKKNRKDAIVILKEINRLNDFYITSIRLLTNINRDDAYICLILLVEYNYVYTIIRERFKDSHMYVKYMVSPKGAKFLNKYKSLNTNEI